MKENKVVIFLTDGDKREFSEGKAVTLRNDKAGTETVKSIAVYGGDVQICFESGRHFEFCGFRFIRDYTPEILDKDIPY
jgi:hypothetical protein